MVTLRTYSSPAEAALAKSLLDSRQVFCCIADENANLYGGGPLAMPVRLLVAEDQADEANWILEQDGTSTLTEPRFRPDVLRRTLATEPEIAGSNNPWELLVIASLFILPGICLLWQKHALLIMPENPFRGAFVTTHVTHGIGWLAVALGFSLVVLYFYARRLIARDQRDALSPLC